MTTCVNTSTSEVDAKTRHDVGVNTSTPEVDAETRHDVGVNTCAEKCVECNATLDRGYLHFCLEHAICRRCVKSEDLKAETCFVCENAPRIAHIIYGIHARSIYDGKGNQMLEVEVNTPKGVFRSAVPCDKTDTGHRGNSGCDVGEAISDVNYQIAPYLLDKKFDVGDQAAIDDFLDTLSCTSKATLAVSMAIAKAGAAARCVNLHRHFGDMAGNNDIVLPVPAFNIRSGDRDPRNRLAVGKLRIMPSGASSFREAVDMGREVYTQLQQIITDQYGEDGVHEEPDGVLVPDIQSCEEGLDLLVLAIDQAGHTNKVKICIDVAASQFCREGFKYDLDFNNSRSDETDFLTSDQLIEVYKELLAKYPIVSIENAFDENDTAAWGKVPIVLQNTQFVSNTIKNNSNSKKPCTAVFLETNKIKTVSDAILSCKKSQEAGLGVIIPDLSPVTDDSFIAELAAGLCTGQIQTGAPCPTGLAKYNQFLRIEEGHQTRFAGEYFRNPGYFTKKAVRDARSALTPIPLADNKAIIVGNSSKKYREDANFDNGFILPPLLLQLKKILEQYPDDSAILKELIQNAEDAGAREIKFLHDKNTYGKDGKLLHHPGLAKYQVLNINETPRITPTWH